MQFVHSRSRTPAIRFHCKFTICRRLVAMFEWLRCTACMGPRPHFSQIRAIVPVVYPREITSSSMIATFLSSPAAFLVWAAAIIVSLSIHEFSHALTAHALGDPTAERAGRLTLNPIAHVDPLGFLMLVMAGFGWGRPVPFNPYNLKFQKWGATLVALAGPVSNFINVIVFGMVLRAVKFATDLPESNLMMQFLVLLVLINLALMLFNLIPIPPLDGSKVLLAVLSGPQHEATRLFLESRGHYLLLAFIIADMVLGLGLLSHLFGWAFALVGRFFLS